MSRVTNVAMIGTAVGVVAIVCRGGHPSRILEIHARVKHPTNDTEWEVQRPISPGSWWTCLYRLADSNAEWAPRRGRGWAEIERVLTEDVAPIVRKWLNDHPEFFEIADLREKLAGIEKLSKEQDEIAAELLEIGALIHSRMQEASKSEWFDKVSPNDPHLSESKVVPKSRLVIE